MEQKPIDNMQKYENYRIQMGRLSKAVKAEFFLEAVFIEYAILEDRLESILVHTGKFNPEKHNTMDKKLRRVQEISREKKSLAHKYFSDELIQSIYDWKESRNTLIHALMKQKLNTDELKDLALTGVDITKKLNSKTTSFKRALEKINSERSK